MSGVAAGTWRVVGASVRGTAHARSGLPCQDAHAWRTLPDGSLALAVADGAGTAAHADAGARAAARAAVDALAEQQADVEDSEALGTAFTRAFQAARRAVESEAATRGVEVRELATTLILALAADEWVAAAQVGDGAVVVEDGEGPRAMTFPRAGEFANETVFLTMEGGPERAQRALWRVRARHVALFTDGLQPLVMSRREPHPPFFAPLFRFAAEADDAESAGAQLAEFLAGPRVAERADDDLTLLVATR